MSDHEDNSAAAAWFERLFYLFIFVWLGIILADATTWGRRDKLLPLLVGVPTGIILLIHLGSLQYPDIFSRLVPEQESAVEEPEVMEPAEIETRSAAQQRRVAVKISLWIIVAAILAYLVGFVIALPIWIFTVSYALLDDLRQAIGVTVIFEILFYAIFIALLEMPLWGGVVSIPLPV